VREQKHSRSEALQKFPGGVEVQDGIVGLSGATVDSASFADPQASAVAIDIDRAGGAPRSSGGQLGPAFYGSIRIGLGKTRLAPERQQHDDVFHDQL
jgi:hypothetical protein